MGTPESLLRHSLSVKCRLSVTGQHRAFLLDIYLSIYVSIHPSVLYNGRLCLWFWKKKIPFKWLSAYFPVAQISSKCKNLFKNNYTNKIFWLFLFYTLTFIPFFTPRKVLIEMPIPALHLLLAWWIAYFVMWIIKLPIACNIKPFLK